VSNLIGYRENAQELTFKAASGMILQNHRRLPVCIFSVKIAAIRSLKRLTELFSKLENSASNFKGASQDFRFDISRL
jgi:hypothetical protein